MASFEDWRMVCLVNKAWNAIGVGTRDTANVIIVFGHQFQEEAHNRDLTQMQKEPILWEMCSLVRIRPPAK